MKNGREQLQHDLKLVIGRLQEAYHPEQIWLFGSAAWGGRRRVHDIDLLVIKKTGLSRADRTTRLYQLLWGLKRHYPVDAIVMTPAEWTRRKRLGDFLICRIAQAGKLLYAA